MLCANCGSDRILPLSVVFERELALFEASATGDDGRPLKRRPSPTLVRSAPPRHRDVDKAIGCIAVFGVIGIAWHVLWVVAVIFLGVAIMDAAWNKNALPKLRAVWEDSYMCEQCGFIGPMTPVAAEVASP